MAPCWRDGAKRKLHNPMCRHNKMALHPQDSAIALILPCRGPPSAPSLPSMMTDAMPNAIAPVRQAGTLIRAVPAKHPAPHRAAPVQLAPSSIRPGFGGVPLRRDSPQARRATVGYDRKASLLSPVCERTGLRRREDRAGSRIAPATAQRRWGSRFFRRMAQQFQVLRWTMLRRKNRGAPSSLRRADPPGTLECPVQATRTALEI